MPSALLLLSAGAASLSQLLLTLLPRLLCWSPAA